MSGNSCFFIGHHDAPESIFPSLLAAVEQHITEYAVTDFFVGRYGSFDRMAARAVRTAKVEHPTVKLTLLLPYHPASCKPERRKALQILTAPVTPPVWNRCPACYGTGNP